MGKLYNRRDLAFDTGRLDRLEQQADIASSSFSALLAANTVSLGVLSEEKTHWLVIPEPELFVIGVFRDLARALQLQNELKYLSVARFFERLRRRSRMQLLRTAQLINDVRQAEARAIAHPCKDCKAKFGAAKTAIWFAGEENLLRRAIMGATQVDVVVAEDGNSLGEWERAYLGDLRIGRWPYAGCYLDYPPGGYLGWLAWQHASGILSDEIYSSEKTRLGAEVST